MSNEYGITPEQYHHGLDQLWKALEGVGVKGVQQDDVFTLSAAAIKMAAAAPDLLEALELALVRLGELGHDNDGTVCRQAKRALAKAKGEIS